MRYPHNHFLTLAERIDKGFRTIEFYPHASARKILDVIDVFERPYWIEVVHSCNVSNELRITSRIQNRFPIKSLSLSDYGLPIHISWPRNILNLLRMAFYFFKVAVWRLSRKWKKKLASKKV